MTTSNFQALVHAFRSHHPDGGRIILTVQDWVPGGGVMDLGVARDPVTGQGERILICSGDTWDELRRKCPTTTDLSTFHGIQVRDIRRGHPVGQGPGGTPDPGGA